MRPRIKNINVKVPQTRASSTRPTNKAKGKRNIPFKLRASDRPLTWRPPS